MSRSTAYDKYPEHRLEFDEERVGLRVRVDGEVLAETTRGLKLREGRYPPVVYVPREDVHMERLRQSDHSTHCPFKGDASYFDVKADTRSDGADDPVDQEVNTRGGNEGSGDSQVAWSYESPFDQMAEIRDHLAFYPDRVTLEILPD